MAASRGPGNQGSDKAGASPPDKADRASTRVVVPFDDNRLLGMLLGEHDTHLALIEQRLGIEAQPLGNVVTLTGPKSACAIAQQVLQDLYARIVRGEPISGGDVDGAIRHARSDAAGEGAAGAKAQIRTRKKVVTARTAMQSSYIKALEQLDLVFGVGPAGTGKTYLAVAYAAQMLERGEVDRIILSRPAVEAGERLGFLPGDMKEKVDPYLRPLYDALHDMMPAEKVERDILAGVIEVAPLAFMRGRTLAHAAVILDEAQNTTHMQMKMFLTRIGEGSKMIVTGDPSQIDLPAGQISGLEEAVGLLENVKGISAVRFTAQDVVRRDLVQRIVKAYESVVSVPTPRLKR